MRNVPLAPMPGRGMEVARLEKAPPPTPEEAAALERVWGHLAPEQRRNRRDLLLPALLALQQARGWISYPALAAVCLELTVPLAEAYGVASFYSMLSVTPGPRTMLHVCDDVACRLKGAAAVARRLEEVLGPPRPHRRAKGVVNGTGAGGPVPAFESGGGDGAPPGASASDAPGSGGEEPEVGWTLCSCLGQCDRAPAVLAGEELLLGATPDKVEAWLRGAQPAPPPPSAVGSLGVGTPLLLRRCGSVNPRSLDDYIAHGGYAGLRRAVAIGPQAALREVERSRLVGRGGAAFPTARKWAAVAAQPAPRYVVCNADESEPGTFKDRVLLEQDPFAVLEGMTIAGFVTGAEKGWLYLRGEYVKARRIVTEAIEQARRAGYLGDGILGTDFSFDIEVRVGAGAYVCGEETALFNSIEGYRGEPRPRPPYPTEAGLFGRPTVVNNVETLACVPPILAAGGERYASVGTEGSAGTKLVSVSGDVVRPGVYEVPFGTPLRTIIEELAGGVPEGRTAQAVLCGGAAGTFLGPEELDTPLAIETLRAIGGTVGSGAIVVFADTADVWDAMERIARFFMEESCGQCVPCRVGTRRQWEWVRAERRRAQNPAAGESEEARQMLADLVAVMRDASICGLGQLAPNAIVSGLRLLGRWSGR